MKHVFIVNTHAGDGKSSEKLRKSLAEIPDFEYFIFNTRRKEKEGQLVKKIERYFKGEKLRIYCCGGSGTFRNILNSVEDLDNVEFAFYPCGMTNDFLKVFGEDEKYFYDVRKLIDGQVHKIDYIETNHGRSLNTFSIGMDTDTLEGMERYRPFGTISGRIPYFLSIIYALFGIKNIEYELSIDGEVQSGRYYEVFFGNGSTIGGNVKFGLDNCANSGRANTYIGPKVNTLTILPHVILTTSGKPEKTVKYGAKLKNDVKELTIKRVDGKPFAMDFDGEWGNPHKSWHAKLIHNGLKFVIPTEVTSGLDEVNFADDTELKRGD